MAQDVYLTPREVFRRLKIFEKQIPLRMFVEYQPLYVKNELTEQALTQEASAMILYAGLLGYKVQCRWSELSERTGGDFTVDADRNVRINVSNQFRNNRAAVLATLAHEVCHAVMHHYRIAQDNRDENEYCTDLATIYMGFGQLIIRGYNTYSEGVNHQLGYLNYNIYTQTYNVINQARNNGIPLMKVPDDMFLDETLTVWCASDHKKELLERKFVDIEKNVTRLVNDRRYLVELVDMILKTPIIQHRLTFITEMYDEYSSLDNVFTHYPIHAMSLLYECLLFDDEDGDKDNDTLLLQKVSMVMERAIANICRLSPQINPGKILPRSECPHCGEVIVDEKNSNAVRRCKKCHKSFCVGDVSGRVEEICHAVNAQSEQSRVENEKKISEAYERGRRKGVESNAATAYQRGYNDAKNLCEKQNAALPSWLRWLNSLYVKKDHK